MKKRRLNYRFHNPNSEKATADYIAELFIEVNTPKIEAALLAAAKEIKEQKVQKESQSA